MSQLSSLTGGGGGISGGPTSGTSGNASSSSGTGAKTINVGGNPNRASIMSTPVLLVAAAVGAFLLWRHFHK